ncbi:MAG: NADH-quinone oxidoreductase subunit J family protein, partial [Acidimicrobiales bacterium]
MFGALMVAENVAFYLIAAVMVGAALRVVTTKDIVHAALYLVLVLSGVAALYILLAAEFIAITQVLVYIGAVIVLFLFGIMLTRAPMHPKDSLDNNLRWPAAVTALFLVGILTGLLVHTFHAEKVNV